MKETNDQVEPNATNGLLGEYKNSETDPPTIWFSKRFYVTLLLFLGCVNMYTMRANLSIALVEMTSNKTITIGNQTIVEPPEFKWSSKQIGVVISMFSYGYLFCLFAGSFSTKFGGSSVYGYSMAAASLITILHPISLRIHFYVFLAFRVLTGICESFAYSSTSEILSRWAPTRERSTLLSYTFVGVYVGNAITYPFCGFIAHKWRWPMVFYVTGLLSLAWSILWLIVVRNDPSKDKTISVKELNYIKQGMDKTPRKEVVHPYGKILLSSSFWALCAGKFTYNVGFTILVYCFPLYIKDITGKSTDQIGLLSSIPHIVCVFSIPLTGTIMDYWKNNTSLNITQIHKIIASIGFIASSSLFVIVTFINDFILSMICFIMITVLISFNYVVCQLVCIYMAPQHSSVLAGLSAFWFTVSSIVTPTVVGFVVKSHSSQEWSLIFLIAAATLIIGAIIFALFVSSELQSWAVPPKNNIEDRPIVKIKKSIKK